MKENNQRHSEQKKKYRVFTKSNVLSFAYLQLYEPLRHIRLSSPEFEVHAQKEIISQTDQYLVTLSSKKYVFEEKMPKY